jgi:glycosyltransferase involved in cell wall biosynthesis
VKIVIYTGPAWETWGAHSILEGGIGGSETAAIRVAEHLVNLNHEVSIIGHVIPGTFNGVSYIGNHPSDSRPFRIECDVFVSSRHLKALSVCKPFTSSGKKPLSVLWVHDIHVGDDWDETLNRYDIIFCLSDWAMKVAMSYYPHVKEERFVRTRNGIEPSLFGSVDAMPVKTGCKLIYSSSPDRGLDRLLDYWPLIRQMAPEATLDVYYGFDTWQKMAEKRHDDDSLLTIAFYRNRLEDMSKVGVTVHGRVGQQELANAFLRSTHWLYPTNFPETSCITAMEAQASGAWPIASRHAALGETVRYGRLIDPPNTRKGYRDEFLGHFEASLGAEAATVEAQLLEGRRWAMTNMSWRGVAEQWEKLFEERLQ